MDYKELEEQLSKLEAIAYSCSINGEVLGMDCSDFERIMADARNAIEELIERVKTVEKKLSHHEKSKRQSNYVPWVKMT